MTEKSLRTPTAEKGENRFDYLLRLERSKLEVTEYLADMYGLCLDDPKFDALLDAIAEVKK